MNTLITGGSGFIGTRLCGELQSGRHQVRIFDLRLSRAYPKLCTIGDVRDSAALTAASQGVEAIFHLAAEHRDDVRPVCLYADVNVGGTRNLVAAAEKTGCRRIIFTSSVAVYPLNLTKPDENTEPRPFSPYGRSKLEAEKVLLDWARRTPGSSLTIVRPSVVFGPSNRGNVFNLINQIYRRRFLMIGGGQNRKSMAFVGNLSNFLASRLEDAKSETHVFNYADKPDLNVAELVTIVHRALDRRPQLLDRLKIPFGAGLVAGYGFDFLSLLTARKLPLSSIRIRKFCAETTISTELLEATGFQRHYSLETALEQWVKEEFSGKSPSDCTLK